MGRLSDLSSDCQHVSPDSCSSPYGLAWIPASSSGPSLPELGWKVSAAGLLGESPYLAETCRLISKAGMAAVPTSEGWRRLDERVLGPDHRARALPMR